MCQPFAAKRKIMTNKQPYFLPALFAFGTLVLMVFYGLILRPLVFDQPQMPLEIVFLLSAVVVIGQLFYLGFNWEEIQQAIVHKLTRAMPTILLLFAIGLLIGCWIIAGTIPMLVYYALKTVSIEHLYIICFIAPIFFSMCTGTSWGSIGTIGLVLIAVAHVFQADLGIAAGAIVGGAYFGDKMSPLSDTTNIAAMVVDVPLYQHISSMTHTTLPAAILAGLGFFALDYIYPLALVEQAGGQLDVLNNTLVGISTLFEFHWLLLLPLVVVIYGSLKQYPPLAVLTLSSMVACGLALGIQSFGLNEVIQTLYKGFNIEMAQVKLAEPYALFELPQHIAVLFNRGGLYELNDPIIIVIMVFIYVGACDCIKAMETLVNQLLAATKTRAMLVSASLVASAVTNSMTSSQYANSFIVGQAFSDKYDQLKVPRRILSRSLEDTGTMLESIVPWTTTAVFIYGTLGVSVYEYWHWQLLTLFNIPLAFILAFTQKENADL
jgi:NhaC family Na+:H+ antiporter